MYLGKSSILLFLCTTLFLSLWSCREQEDPYEEQEPDPYLALPLAERQSADHATDAFRVAEGLKVKAFATEPMVVNPTNLAVDARGRIWVCESYNYAVPEEEQTESGGRITILEDTDQDGSADKRTVFYQGEDVHLALGIAVLGDRVFVTRSPNLLVFTDENGDDVPDSKDSLFTGMGNPGDHSAHVVVFGPDGRFYFNYGNAGIKVEDKNGEIISDIHGNPIISNGNPFHGGMVFRFEEGGENLEILAHNFRNNYEVAIDAFGTLWQSDNDDDGNKSVRINYVMEYGNFGYLDELTGAHWAQPRIGMHDSIPQRHWHQNDPGVVPNLLITGAGSPAGISVYEGDLLPEVFQNQVIHTDAGPNVVRAYPIEKDGAGYQARIENLLQNPYDQWFRPVDLDVAPDGSIFVADWYDPIVGGGAAGDHVKGRVFRVAPPNHKYQIEVPDLSILENAAEHLASPNQDIRYQAWQTLRSSGMDAQPFLEGIWTERDNARARARALWLLAQLPEVGSEYIDQALNDDNPDIQITAVRAARQIRGSIPDIIETLLNDPSPAVRRELAIALRFETDDRSSLSWSKLAAQHQDDRWYLEALGIGADLNWPERFSSWRNGLTDPISSASARDIVWRSRAPIATEWLARIILSDQVDTHERIRYFRAFDFHEHEEKNHDLLSLLDTNHRDQAQIRSLTLQALDPEAISLTPSVQYALNQTLDELAGTWQFVDLVKKYQLVYRAEELLALGEQSFTNDAGFDAIQALADPNGLDRLDLIRTSVKNNPETADALIHALRASVNEKTLNYLSEIVRDTALDLAVRKDGIEVLGSSWWGEEVLLETVKEPDFPEDVKEAAAAVLFSVYRVNIHQEAAEYLERPGSEGQVLSPVRVLVATVGNAEKGAEVFTTNCQTCHQIDGEGVAFGPDLSQIGSKLDQEGLYRSIIYPSEGVNYGYETYEVDLKEGGTMVGLLSSETAKAVTLKLIGDVEQSYSRGQIKDMRKADYSLMTDLTQVMSEEELIDLVNYLASLKAPT